ncbi:MAG: prepilin peptidase [Prochlorococcus sp.]|nr:prepilin peptidase [Prochlorococcus sp.]CAI8166798.1 MAG: Type 4 prepilin-like proteins leader peptide-processing enzyme [Prochlorococcus marinus str. MIT 9215]
MILITLAIAGACIGSFINVVAWRLPRKESLVWPGSHCTRCGKDVRWHDNLPVIGWFQLGGHCRDCNASIPFRYPAVEALSAGLWLTAALANPTDMGAMPAMFSICAGVTLISLLLPLVLIDLDHMVLPEPICRVGVLCGLLTTLIAASHLGRAEGSALMLDHLLATAAALLAMEGLSAIAEKLIGQPALGLGDAKLAAMGGAWLGLSGISMAIWLAVFSGALVGLAGRLTGRLQPKQAFPFGPFIASGIWAVWFCGSAWWWQELQSLLGL